LKARIGYNRLEINFNVVDASTSKVGIYWNDYQDSVMVDITSATAVKQIINLSEGQYSLFVKSFDKKGNSSNPLELITRTVGENYLASLAHRGFKSKSTSFNNDLLIEWQNADPINGARFTKLVYTTIDGTEKTIQIENETTTTSITDYKEGTSFKRITYYSPDNQWLDTITPPIIAETDLMISKKLGKVIAFSTQNGGNVATNFYNGNTADMWLTNNNYPEFATIDLGREIPVSGFGVWPSYQQTNGRADPRAPTTIKFECSRNNEDWVTISEFDYDNSMYYYSRLFEIPVTNARYVRFMGVECTESPVYSSSIGGPGNKLMNLAELDVFFSLESE
ncbi:MAG: hypothetical protein GXZ19_12380, partial [Bacteroidales bacterium]|nr:hypothetical protein [Bacteroidales bacterium]